MGIIIISVILFVILFVVRDIFDIYNPESFGYLSNEYKEFLGKYKGYHDNYVKFVDDLGLEKWVDFIYKKSDYEVSMSWRFRSRIIKAIFFGLLIGIILTFLLTLSIKHYDNPVFSDSKEIYAVSSVSYLDVSHHTDWESRPVDDGVYYDSVKVIKEDNKHVIRYVTNTENGMKVNELPASSVYVKIGDYAPTVISYYSRPECTWNSFWHFHGLCNTLETKYLYSEILIPENYTSEYDWMLE